jgi:YspA, cpYpsA-related SLOG family
MKVVICGSRNWIEEQPIRDIIVALSVGSTVIHGGASGADSITEKVAKESNIETEIFNADWDVYGKFAGPKRNIEMLEQNLDHVYAFPLDESRGTWHTIREAEKRGIPVTIYNG